jgi:hypothetical protein
LGELDVRRHFSSGAVWAMAGIETAEVASAAVAPPCRNILRFKTASSPVDLFHLT